MTTSDILSVVGTVLMVQLVCDGLSNRLVFSHEKYQHLCRVLERARTKLSKLQANKKNDTEKHLKRLAQAKNDVGEAAAEVARRHSQTSMYTGLVFLVLYRILSTEYQGRVLAVLPFVPYGFVRFFSMRGIDLPTSDNNQDLFNGRGVSDPTQACGFLFVYILSTLSVKFFVTHLIGTKPPKGAEGGMMTIIDSPYGQRTLKAWGVDADSLRVD